MTALIWILSSCVLILVVLLIRALFGRKLRPGLRYALWALVLARLLIPGSLWTSPVSVEAPVSRTELGQDLDLLREVDTVTRSPEGDVSGVSARPVPGRGQEERSVVLAQDVTPERFERLRSTLSLRNAAETVWVTGSVAALAVFIVTNTAFYVNLRKRRRLLDTQCPVRVYQVEGLESSCLFLNAIYVNPATAEDGIKLRHVLAHELSHRRHLDGLWALARCAALTVHWFNPLVWLAASESRQDSELLADAGALRRLGEEERESYGGTIISLSVHAPRAVSPLCAATAMAGGKKALRARVEQIARKPKATVAVLLAVVLIAGIAVGCTFAGAASGKGGEVDSDEIPGGSLPAGTGSGELPQTPSIGVFESAALNVALLYPAGWDDLCAMTETRLPEDYVPGGEGYVPCVAIALWGELLGLVSAPGDYVLGPAAAFVYWSPAGESGPEAESGESVTLYTDGDGSELRCYLPMTDKLNWSGVDAGPYAQRIYDAFDTIERDILDGKLACRSISALEELSSLPLEELFALYDGDGGYNEFVLVHLIDRFLAAPVPFLAALAEEPEAFREVFTARMGVSLSAWYPSEAQACFDALAGESLDPRQAALLDAIVSMFDAHGEGSPAGLADLGFDEPYLDRYAGVTMELLYEGEDSIIFAGETGVWGYDLREERITFGIDLLKVFNEMVYFQGDPNPYSVYVSVSADGRELVLSCADPDETDDPDNERETYYIDVPTLTYRKGEYRRPENTFRSEDAVGTLVPGMFIGQATYIRGGRTYQLFK